MNYSLQISPTDIRDYAKVHGWQPVVEALVDRLFVLNHPTAKYRQIRVPIDANRPDYGDAVRVAIENLAELEQRPFRAVEASLLEAGDDTLRLAISTQRVLDEGLPFSYAARAMAGAEKALRAAACSEVQRQAFHPKMNRSEAQKMVESAQLRHTEAGSFVLKIACPIDAVGDETPLLKEPPFVRRALLGMREAITDLVSAVESDTLADLVQKAQQGKSALSANLCEGLLAFQEDDVKASLDFSVAWSARLEEPPPICQNKTRIQWGYFPRIEQVRLALRPEQSPLTQPFIGIVDELKGDLGPGEEREGEVILDLLLVGGESLKAKAILGVEHHKIAHLAYGQGKTYVKVAGTLQPGKQPRRLTDVTSFEIVAN